jgi:hypothetical protein
MNNMILWHSLLFLFKKSDLDSEYESNEAETDLLCRFVHDGAGRDVGESIAIQNDLLIVKDGVSFLGIPLKHIEEDGSKLLVKGLVDTTKAKELGELWRQSSLEKTDEE